MQRITPFLWFDNQAEEAANFHVSVFKNSKVKQITHYTGEEFSEKRGQVMKVTCSISTLNAVLAAKYQMFRCDPVPYPISDFRVSAFPLSPIRQWFR